MDQNEDELLFRARVEKRLLARCYKNLNFFYKSPNFAVFRNKFASMDIEIPIDLFSCKNCDNSLTGKYFYKQKKIILCANNLIDENFNSEATKLMTKAYDDARANINSNDPLQMACTILRSVNLGGECKDKSSLNLFSLSSAYYKCVRERSIKELARCFNSSRENAEDIINDVWDTCITDLDPFNVNDYSFKFS